MTTPAITVEALPAGYGDAILVTCAMPAGPWRLLVDTGPDECWPALRTRLSRIPADGTGHRLIDLAVITHIDHDHIGGARALFGDTSLGLRFGDVWFNAPAAPASRGVAEGRDLAAVLGAHASGLPWNRAWQGRHAVTSAGALFVEVPHAPGAPKLTLLSPTPAKLAALFRVWARELARLDTMPKAGMAAAASRGGPALDLAALANASTAVDRAPANGSSITLLAEHQGASVLLGADAHPRVLVPALKALAAHRRAVLPLLVDVFKLPHHGSRANVTSELLRIVQARDFIFSTNGAVFGHPDAEGVARVITGGGSRPALWFNYRSAHTVRWLDPGLQAKHDYRAHEPDTASSGIVINIASGGSDSARR